MFETATRKKFRFPSPKGQITVEDLWNLPLISNKEGEASLNFCAQVLHRRIIEDTQASFVSLGVNEGPTEDKEKLELVKHIIKIREDETIAATKSAENRKLKSQLMGILADKQSEAWKSMSPEKLQEIIATLN